MSRKDKKLLDDANNRLDAKRFEDAWVLVPIDDPHFDDRAWTKLSSLSFHYRYDEASSQGPISRVETSNRREAIGFCDFASMDIVVEDIEPLDAKTPFELFIALELRGLVEFI